MNGAGGRVANTKAQTPWRLRQARLACAKDRHCGPLGESSGTRQLHLPLMRAGHPSLQKPRKATPGVWTCRRAWQVTRPRRGRLRERRVAGPPGVTNEGGGDGDARVAVAEGEVLREASVRETTNEAATAVGDASAASPNKEERTEPDCGTSAYRGPTATKEDGERMCLL